MMRLRFHTPALAAVCNHQAELERKWGQLIATEIRRRLCLLAAVPNLALLARFPGVLESPIRVDGRGRFSVKVRTNCLILLQPDHDPIPYLPSGKLACKDVEHLIILEVNGYGL
jgi:hypothetical protein